MTKTAETETTTYAPDRMAINFGAGLISCDLVEIAPAVAMCGVEGRFDIRQVGPEGHADADAALAAEIPAEYAGLPCGDHSRYSGAQQYDHLGETAGAIAVCEAAEIILRGDAEMGAGGGLRGEGQSDRDAAAVPAETGDLYAQRPAGNGMPAVRRRGRRVGVWRGGGRWWFWKKTNRP